MAGRLGGEDQIRWRGMAVEGGMLATRPGSYGLRLAWQVPHTETSPRAKAADALIELKMQGDYLQKIVLSKIV